MRWALLASLFLAVPAAAQVKTDHLLGKFSTTDDGCKDAATQDFEIRRGIVEGPDLFCILGAVVPADKGTEAYEARCKTGGKTQLGTLIFDLSGKPEHIRIMPPEAKDWTTLYVCH
ncbi:MAG: hypothetical protein AB7G54_01825 [Methyloceanibacter sp.]